MSTQTEQIESLVEAALADGLTPVVEGDTVDLRLVKDNVVVAAIRVHLTPWSSSFEYPARRGVGSIADPGRHPWGQGSFETRHMRDLDRWWSQVPGTGRTWRSDPFPWARAGYWQRRLGHDLGPVAELERANAAS